jgi:Flp pilus assembly protein TadD
VRLVERAATAEKNGEHERALTMLDRADALWPGDERAQELRVEVHAGVAKARLERLGREEHDVDLRLDATEALLEIGRTREALRTIEPAAEYIRSIDPHRLSWRAGEALLRGRALLGVDEPAKAAECFSLARELWPTEAEPRYYLGVAMVRAGRSAEGRRAFIEACGIDAELARERLRELRDVTAGPG